jgi:hypothetical protein
MEDRQVEQGGAGQVSAEVGPTDAARRRFLAQVAAAGMGVAGLGLMTEEAHAAVPEFLLGTYTVNQGFGVNALNIQSQSGQIFVGRFDDGTAVSGWVAGASPSPITICFTRTAPDGTVLIYSGGGSTRPAGRNTEVLLAGTYSQNGTGPFPWIATGNVHR